MGKTITSQGKYEGKNGAVKDFEFEYPVFDSLQDAIDILGEEKALKTIQRMVKVDASNTAREGAKVANGDSTRKVMSESEKAEAKAQRAENKKILDLIKAKGLTQEEIASLLA
jgi:hypothetical protein